MSQSSTSPLEPKPQRLAGNTLLGARLWLKGDQLINVRSHLGFEHYRRIFLGEIEALILCRTSTGLTWTIIGGIGAIVCAAIALIPYIASLKEQTHDPMMIWSAVTFAVLSGLFVAATIFNIYLGPTALMFAQSRAGHERLAAVRRLRKGRRLRTTLLPIIQAAQKGIAPAVETSVPIETATPAPEPPAETLP